MTRARYTLLGIAERSTTIEGSAFETGRRDNWSFLLNVSALDGGASVTVAIETSPTGYAGTWSEVYAFAAATSVASILKRQRDEAASFAGPTSRDLYVRAVIKAATGNSIVELISWAPFFDLEDDLDLLSQELREWDDGLARTVESAEDEVLRLLVIKNADGAYEANLLDPRFPAAIKDAIAVQSEHKYRAARLLESTEPAKQVTARDLPTIAPEVYRILDEFLAREVGVWRGR